MSEENPENNERNPFTTRGFIISAALVVALVAAVVVIAFLPNDSNQPSSAVQSTAPTESSTSAPAKQATGGSTCGLPGNDETALGAAPESEWELVGTMAVPTAPRTIGPGVIRESGLRSCFAQTPTGALYAAANIWATGFYGDSEKLYKHLSARGPARKAAMNAIKRGETVGPSNPPPMQIQGFILRSYTDKRAVVDLAVETEAGSYGSLPTPLVWEDGDWKLDLPPTGDTGLRQLESLSAYIHWAGV